MLRRLAAAIAENSVSLALQYKCVCVSFAMEIYYRLQFNVYAFVHRSIAFAHSIALVNRSSKLLQCGIALIQTIHFQFGNVLREITQKIYGRNGKKKISALKSKKKKESELLSHSHKDRDYISPPFAIAALLQFIEEKKKIADVSIQKFRIQ